MRGLFAAAIVLGLLWLQDTFPPQVVPQETFPAHSAGEQTFPPQGGAASVYDEAAAVWTFNDLADLGHDDTGNGNDLTPANSPTATGGALSYAFDGDGATQYASVSDNTSNSLGDGVSWGVVGWARPNASTDAWVGKGSSAADGDMDSFWTLAGNFTCRLHDDISVKSDTQGSFPAAAARVFVHCRYNATANELEAGFNGSWSGSPTATDSDGADNANDFVVAGHQGGLYADGVVGPVWWYRSASGGEVLTDAYATSLYNSGKGKTCADTTETANLVSCWDMSEDGGPYADSVGSNTLTAAGSPPRAAGLVETSDSGMAAHLTAADEYFNTTTPGTITAQNQDGYTIAAWYNSRASTAAYVQICAHQTSQAESVTLNAANRLVFTYTGPGGAQIATVTDAGALNQWHLGIAWFDGSTGYAYAQMDDGTVYTSAGTTTTISTAWAANGWWIGHSGSNEELDIDNAAVWLRVLTAAERSQLWASGAGKFFAGVWDVFFERPRFAWSARPELRRTGS